MNKQYYYKKASETESPLYNVYVEYQGSGFTEILYEFVSLQYAHMIVAELEGEI